MKMIFLSLEVILKASEEKSDRFDDTEEQTTAVC